MTVLAACAGSSSGPDPAELGDSIDEGSWYVREQWPHDGKQYESDRFVVYSDSASLQARMELAESAERLWSEILDEMSIDSGLLTMPPGQEKIDIYAFEDRSPEWSGKAYHGGLLISSPHRRILFGLARTDTEQYEATLKHELVHVASESLLHGGGLEEPPWVSAWFFEGIAEVLSSGTGSGSIRGMDHFEYLTSKYGHLNPVAYRTDDTDEGDPIAFAEYHYPMRQLAVEYLFDDAGLGIPLPEATAVLVDVASGAQFDAAFADHVGITEADYEDRFFELMDRYLPENSDTIVLGPTAVLAIVVISIGLAVTGSVWSIRTSPGANAAAEAASTSHSTRAATLGFVVWLTAVSVLSLGIYLIGIDAIAGSWKVSRVGKILGMALLFGYLATCALAVTWSARRRRSQSPIAWLISLAPIGAAVVTAAITIKLL